MWTVALVVVALVTMGVAFEIWVWAADHWDWDRYPPAKIVAYGVALCVFVAGAYILHTLDPSLI